MFQPADIEEHGDWMSMSRSSDVEEFWVYIQKYIYGYWKKTVQIEKGDKLRKSLYASIVETAKMPTTYSNFEIWKYVLWLWIENKPNVLHSNIWNGLTELEACQLASLIP